MCHLSSKMFLQYSLLVVGCLVTVESVTSSRHREMVKLINMHNLSWTATIGLSDENQRTFGTVLSMRSSGLLPVKERNVDLPDDEIPPTFNARSAWPRCWRIDHPRNQGACRADWAIAAASVLTDRFCIKFWSLYKAPVSAFHVLACCADCGDGCESGSASEAWKFFETNGTVTGGDRHSQVGCLPYQVDGCDHRPTSNSSCSFGYALASPKCPDRCIDNRFDINRNRLFVKRSYAIRNDVEEIQKEILLNGPVQASMAVYEDFLYYNGKNKEVYYHYLGDLLGGLSVKIIGWGADDESGIDYWLAMSSWGREWGQSGAFRIRRGTNECGIESNVIAGDPLMDHHAR